jgi:hypothetical protein
VRIHSALPVAVPLALAWGWVVQEPADAPAGALADAARAVLESLTPEQQSELHHPLAAADFLDWHYIPRERPGLALAAMDVPQRAAVDHLLRAALGARGRNSVEAVRQLEGVLREIESRGGRDASHRDPLLYDLAIFGEPSAAGAWAFRFEGHHVSVTVAADGRGNFGFTPFFLGANPRRVPDGPRAGAEALQDREQAARAVLLAFDPQHRAQALAGAQPPGDLLLPPGAALRRLEPAGLRCDRLADGERAALLALFDGILGDLHPDLGGRELQDLARAQLADTWFAWIGAAERGEPHGFRLQSPRLLYEWTTTQGDANHVHACLRDLERDASLGWGRALQADAAAGAPASGR